MQAKLRIIIVAFASSFAALLVSPISTLGFTLDEIEETLRSNLARVQSGSVTYIFSEVRPKENLAAAMVLADPDHQVPVLVGEQDVLFYGKGVFKWQGMAYCAYADRPSFWTLPGSEPRIDILSMAWTCDPAGSRKSLTRRYALYDDISNVQADVKNRGSLLSSRGVVGKVDWVSNIPSFRDLAWFSRRHFEEEGPIQHNFLPSYRVESGQVVFSRRTMKGDLYLDPQKSFMPVKLVVGDEGYEGFTRETEYQLINDVWFPTADSTSYYNKGNLLHTAHCEMISYEFNMNYPQDEFNITFPSGTKVVDNDTDYEHTVGELE